MKHKRKATKQTNALKNSAALAMVASLRIAISSSVLRFSASVVCSACVRVCVVCADAECSKMTCAQAVICACYVTTHKNNNKTRHTAHTLMVATMRDSFCLMYCTSLSSPPVPTIFEVICLMSRGSRLLPTPGEPLRGGAEISSCAATATAGEAPRPSPRFPGRMTGRSLLLSGLSGLGGVFSVVLALVRSCKDRVSSWAATRRDACLCEKRHGSLIMRRAGATGQGAGG